MSIYNNKQLTILKYNLLLAGKLTNNTIKADCAWKRINMIFIKIILSNLKVKREILFLR